VDGLSRLETDVEPAQDSLKVLLFNVSDSVDAKAFGGLEVQAVVNLGSFLRQQLDEPGRCGDSPDSVRRSR
jgi:hypothetical protein